MADKNEDSWYRDEKFWREYHPLMFDPDRLADSGMEAERILALAGITDSGDILDLCCGEGRHHSAWSKRGHRVTGVDLCKGYLDNARRRAERDGTYNRYLQADIREIGFSGEFDLVVNYFTSFGYFCEEEDDLKVARKAYEALKPSGVFLIETQSLETTCLNFQEREWFERDGLTILKENRVCDGWTRIEKRWIFFGDDAHPQIPRHSHTITHSLYSANDMGRLLAEAGFREIVFYGGIDGRPYDQNAETMVAVASRG